MKIQPRRLREKLTLTIGGGDIETGSLLAIGGSDALISMVSSGDITVDGDFSRGQILKITHPASAQVWAKADGDLEINGGIIAAIC